MTPRGTTPRGAPPGRVKIVMVGNHGVGKTAITQRLLGRNHQGTAPAEVSPTVGVDFAKKQLQIDKDSWPCRLHIWDTSGQERFRSLVDSHLQDLSAGDAVIIVYDVCDEASFAAIDQWVSEVRHASRVSPQLAILGNKSDKALAGGARKVLTADGQRKADELGATLFLETCGLAQDAEGADTDRLFQIFVDSLVRKCRAAAPPETPRGTATPRSVHNGLGLEGIAQPKLKQSSKMGMSYLCKCPWRAAFKCFAFA